MTIRMKGFGNHSGFSHDGVHYPPSKDGMIEIPHEAVEAARCHGFTVLAEQPSPRQTPAAPPQGGEAGAGEKPGEPPAEEPSLGNDTSTEEEKTDFAKMTKVELVTFAKTKLGMDLVPDTMTKAAMIAEIEAAQGKEAGAE